MDRVFRVNNCGKEYEWSVGWGRKRVQQYYNLFKHISSMNHGWHIYCSPLPFSTFLKNTNLHQKWEAMLLFLSMYAVVIDINSTWVADQCGFYFISLQRGQGRDMSILCEWTKKERKKNQSKIFTKCVPRDRFSWNQNKPLYTNIYRPTQNLIVFLWVRSAIYFPRKATPAIWAKVEIEYKRT